MAKTKQIYKRRNRDSSPVRNPTQPKEVWVESASDDQVGTGVAQSAASDQVEDKVPQPKEIQQSSQALAVEDDVQESFGSSDSSFESSEQSSSSDSEDGTLPCVFVVTKVVNNHGTLRSQKQKCFRRHDHALAYARYLLQNTFGKSVLKDLDMAHEFQFCGWAKCYVLDEVFQVQISWTCRKLHD